MPHISAISTIDLPNRIEQQEIKEQARLAFSERFSQINRMIQAFDNTEIATRNFCEPLDYYLTPNTFEDRNSKYQEATLKWSVDVIEECLSKAGKQKDDITDIVFVSTTGLATPSMDALIINRMRLNPHINRTPIFGLGCAGGVSGMAKANLLAMANPRAVVLLVAVELCSLTLLRHDYSKSNFIGSSLFSDGIAACLIEGDDQPGDKKVRYKAASSKLYYDSLEVMGWDFTNTGFKVLFSKDIPAFIHQHVRGDIEDFLVKQEIELSSIRNFIFHPGGKKVLDAYQDALKVDGDFLAKTRSVMKNYGNMSSVTVLYVLEKFMNEGFEDGFGLMLAMGPGFSCEMVLLEMVN
ncbi:MAG TPA: 3-oxoacyl-[acyl-carrier-protein] synthase III C-terminal domain-containing protein [Mucilaginibacter sp.]|nr:3-oxoacyl-[acyl-carrier-protein] synthase III C-terminal domain-containing protein [Mucilaginibacter sp.]